MVIEITTRVDGRADVRFPYDAAAIELIRRFGGRTWDPRRRCWCINQRQVPVAVQLFVEAGYPVALDGKLQAGAASNPFVALKASMDDYTWAGVCRVLDAELEDRRLRRLLHRASGAPHARKAS